MSDIFFSYKREDRPAVAPIVEALERVGLKVWWDERLEGGELYTRRIMERIDQAQVTIVYWTRESVKSNWVLSEAQRADQRKTLYPIACGRPDIPLPFNMQHSHELSDRPSSNDLHDLAERVKARIKASERAEIALEQQIKAPSSSGATASTLGKILFYQQLEPLSLEKHRGLGVSQVSNPFSFLADTHLVPLTVDEFGLAAVCYPIIFDTQAKTPLAVMGLRPGMNVFLGADGGLDPEVYLPAFARRYPFLPVISPADQAKQASTDSDRVLVCIDRAAKMISNRPENPFFEGDKPSKFTQEAIQFCREFDALGKRTKEFQNVIDDHGLFETTPLSLPRSKPDGSPDEPVKIGEYLKISEAKMNALPLQKYGELRDRGVTAVMHAHLLSLGLWPKILSRAARIQASTSN